MIPQSADPILNIIGECGKLSTALASCLANDTSPASPLSDVRRHVGPVVAGMVELDGDEEAGVVSTRVMECFVDEYRSIHGAQAARDLLATFVAQLDENLKEG